MSRLESHLIAIVIVIHLLVVGANERSVCWTLKEKVDIFYKFWKKNRPTNVPSSNLELEVKFELTFDFIASPLSLLIARDRFFALLFSVSKSPPPPRKKTGKWTKQMLFSVVKPQPTDLITKHQTDNRYKTKQDKKGRRRGWRWAKKSLTVKPIIRK